MPEVITNNLSIWTAALKRKSSAGRGKNGKTSLHGINKLRELILELAVRGKLVSQDLNDEPASVLLKKIAEEKEQLVKDKRIKKQKPLPPISDTEKPFELPGRWVFSYLEFISDINGGFAFKSSNYVDEGVRVIRISDFDEKGFKDNKVVRYKYNDDLEQYLLFENNILMAMTGGTVGKCLLVKIPSEKMVVNQRVATIKLMPFVSPDYINYVLQTSTVKNIIHEAKNSTNDNISMSDIKRFFIPIPSVTEQHRIVAKVGELMALCDQLEQQQTDSLQAHQTLVRVFLDRMVDNANTGQAIHTELIDAFDTLFTTEAAIDQLKQTILQLAVMGKLVPQNPNDEPASVLLEKITEEKEQLIKDKKIKKQKPLPPIGDEEKPFELPEGWEFCRLQELGHDLGGGTPSKSNLNYWGGGMPWVSPKDMKVDFISTSQDSVTKKAVEETIVKLIPKGSLLLVVRGMILAHSFPVAITTRSVVINQDMKALVFSQMQAEYLLLIMKSLKEYVVSQVDRSSHGTCKLVSEKLWKIVLPVPPIGEQHRIVAKVDELMILCDTLKARLNEAQTTQTQLADAIVEQAVV